MSALLSRVQTCVMRGCVCTLLWASLGVSLARGQAPDRSAEAWFRTAEQHVARDEWGEALEAFRRSYELSRDADVLFNVALAEGRLFLYLDAHRDLRRYLQQAPAISPERRAEVEQLIAGLERERIGFVRVTSQPEGATLTLDGRELGQSPLDAAVPVSPGEHVLTAALAGHEVARADVTIVAGRTEEVVLRLPRIRPARLSLDVRPAGATVFIDGEPVGTSPFGAPLSMQPGSYALETSLDGHRTDRRRVRVDAGNVVRVSVRLVALPARLVLDVSPRDAAVRIDGRPSPATPSGTETRGGAALLSPGRHRLVVTADGHDDFTTSVVLSPGERRALRVRLTRRTVLSSPWFWVATGAAVVGAGTAGYFLLRPDTDRTEVGAPTLGAR